MEDRQLTLGSLFDGSGGFMLAARNVGIRPVWASELAPFPTAVARRNFPGVRHYGDITGLNGSELEPVDIITGGSPCQDLSIAGKRAGIVEGKRSNLFFEQMRIVREMRDATDGKYPRCLVWENVPGAFSSSGGEDFRTVLEKIAEVKKAGISVPRPERWNNSGCIMADGFSAAWRVIDAEYFGVPQRRRRIYLVADFGGQGAGKILFECLGVQGDTREGEAEGEEASGSPGEGACEAGRDVMAFENHFQDARYRRLKGSSTTISAFGHGDNNPLVAETFDVRFTSEKTRVSRACVYETGTSRTIDTGGNTPGSNQGGVAVVVDQGAGKGSCSVSEEVSPTLSCAHDGAPAVAVQGSVIGRKPRNGPGGSGVNEDVCFTLDATDSHAVAYGISREAYNQGRDAKFSFSVERESQPPLMARGPGAVSYGITRGTVNSSKKFSTVSVTEETSPTLLECGGTSVAEHFSANKSSFFSKGEREKAGVLCATDYKDPPIVNDTDGKEYVVRRLTPLECARLQGFPDGWTDNLGNENPSEEEMEFWTDLFNQNSDAEGKKRKSEREIRKWLGNPYSDANAYKLWGNGIALPCAEFVLRGIAEYMENENKGDE